MKMRIARPMRRLYVYEPGRNPHVVVSTLGERCGWLLLESKGRCQAPIHIVADMRGDGDALPISATLCVEHFIEIVRNYREKETQKWKS